MSDERRRREQRLAAAGTPPVGWPSFQPRWERISRAEPELLE